MSSEPALALRVEQVGKRYRLGTGVHHNLLAERLGAGLRGWRRRHGEDAQDFWPLRDVDFEVRRGEALGLIGRNGAGKSTLLKLISRITRPTTGRIESWGRIATLLEVGTGFHPELTGRENVYLNGAILGMRRREIDMRFDAIADFAGIDQFLDTPVKRYSSGMFVRLGFAVAAHLETDILLVDEVLAVGDSEFQRKCLGKMQDVAQEGRTVVFVSHNMHAVQRLCTRVLLIDGGVIDDGAPDDVVAKYLDEVDPSQTGAMARIAPDAERQGSGEARLTSVGMSTVSDEPTTSLYLGQPFVVTMTYDVRAQIAEAAWEVGLCTADGERIVTAQSIDYSAPTLPLATGSHRVDVEIRTFLLPGDYRLEIQLHDAAKEATIDCVQRALRFHVLNAAEHGDDRYPWQSVRGYVRPESTWTLGAEMETKA